MSGRSAVANMCFIAAEGGSSTNILVLATQKTLLLFCNLCTITVRAVHFLHQTSVVLGAFVCVKLSLGCNGRCGRRTNPW